jgi:alpha-D-ribose 1-methylphosphonate 5-triphosphate synthase subunit PhnH
VTAAPTLTPRAAREQQTFRVLLDAMARPGSLSHLPLHSAGGDFAPAVSALETLVDHEVTFAIAAEAPELLEIVLRQTGGRHAAAAIADYVVCSAAELAGVLGEVKCGELEQPDRSATVICLVAGLFAESGSGDAIVLSGPGIDGRRVLRADGFDALARRVFSERNGTPPLGVDLILFTAAGDVTCLPRYTVLHEA